jgi:hypothetical protein
MLDGERDGLELLEQAKRILPSLFTVMITGWDLNDIAGRMGASPAGQDSCASRSIPTRW